MDKRRSKLPEEVNEFLKYGDVAFKESTVTTYTTALNRFYIFLKKRYPNEPDLISKVNRSVMEEWFSDLYQAGLKPASRILLLMNIRCYLSWAYERGYVEHYPRDLIRSSDFPKKPDYLPRPLEPDHDRTLQGYLKTSDVLSEKGLLLLRHIGTRVGDLLSMPCNCLHQEEDGKYSIKVPLGKLNSERLVPLTDESARLVRELQKRAQARRYMRINKVCPECDHGKMIKAKIKHPVELNLMYGNHGSVLSYSAMRAAMKRACEKAGIPYYTVHQLRHTFATSLLNAGVSIVTVQRLLGHKKISMTLRYAKVTQETIRKEYYNAIQKTKDQYEIKSPYEEEISDPLSSLTDLIRMIEKKRQELPDPKSDKKKLQLLKRMRRLENELKHIL